MLSMKVLSAALIILVLAAWTGAAQTTYVEGDLFVADRGNNSNGSDGEIRRYSHNGQLRATIAPGGSGAIRGIAFDEAGVLYVARGNSVIRLLPPTYAPAPVVFATGIKAQDVAFNRSTKNIWVSWGANAAEAQITEITPVGTVVQTITSATLTHPRSIAFDWGGNFLYVANGSGGNVKIVDVASGQVNNYATLTQGTATFNAVGCSVDPTGAVFVVGDYGATAAIIKITGPTGNTTATPYLVYGTQTAFKAPAGCYADSWGNVYFACRSQNGATAGVYPYSGAAPIAILSAFAGTEHINPIDVAFKLEPLTITVSSPDGTDASGIPLAISGLAQPTIVITIDAPNYPNRPYGILLSTAPNAFATQCATAQPSVPNPAVGVPLAVGEPRRMPLSLDILFSQSLAAAGAGSGLVSVNQPGAVCVDPLGNVSIPGLAINFSGVTDPGGQGIALFTLPSIPCLPSGANIFITVAGAVVDGTGPLGIGAMSNVPTCFRITR